jgi:hypothetical protein
MDDKTWLVINRLWQENSSNSQGVRGLGGKWPSLGGPLSDLAQSSPHRRANLHWKHLVRGGAVMFGEEFGDCWHEIPGVSGLELSGDLRFRGPRVLRKLRHDCNGRPYVQARKVVNHESDGRVREGRVMLHRAVMSVVLGRQLGRDEFVCHRDDDRRNNWPQNLYIGDYHSNAADSLRNGGRVRGEQHPFAKLSDEQVPRASCGSATTASWPIVIAERSWRDVGSCWGPPRKPTRTCSIHCRSVNRQ